MAATSAATAMAATTTYGKSDLNKLVLSYLIIEGYESAATKFAEEAGITPRISTDCIADRVQIRSAINRGDIIDAIRLINELNPELLDTDKELHFMLLRLHLIELIRVHLASPTPWSLSGLLEFAAQSLAPRAQQSSDCLADLEQTMSLLCFSPEILDPASRKLLHTDTRHRVAETVNAALLESQGIAREAKIKGLVRLFMWQEGKEKEAADIAAAAAAAAAATTAATAAGSGGDVAMIDPAAAGTGTGTGGYTAGSGLGAGTGTTALAPPLAQTSGRTAAH